MGNLILDCVLDALKDGAFSLPVLFIAYLLMELLERSGKFNENMLRVYSRASGPALGGILGAIPQCGISGAAAASAGSATAAGSGVCGFSGASGGSGRGSAYCCGFASGLGAAFLQRRLPPACPLRGALGLAATCSGAAASVCSACSARVFGSCGDFVFWGSLFCFCVPVLRCAVLLLLAWGLAILPCPVPGAVLPCVRCPPLALGFGCCAGSIAVCVTFSSSIAFSTNTCDLSLL